ncbi:MAG: RnfABCDGE type electron transport complex subunit D [Deltaproteobacteria bacterium]|nr:RnfABCDGE type electron transport complex subunit D [Deltaproteobacteria bacterium]
MNPLNSTKREVGRPHLRDPRFYQIAVLSILAIYGIAILEFDVTPSRAAISIASAVGFQLLATWLLRLPTFDPKSAMISGLSLALLFRSDYLLVLLLASAVTIFSKFLIRANGKHIFNPTNFGIVVAIVITGEAWVSPGQWGSFALFALLVSGLGLIVVTRAARSDVTLAFLLFYGAMLLGRGYWLNDPWEIPLHQLSSGSLLIFAFFMISDPKTTPDSRPGRIAFAFSVAAVAYVFRFRFFEPNGLLYALVICSAFVPIIDWVSKGRRYQWGDPKGMIGAPSVAG